MDRLRNVCGNAVMAPFRQQIFVMCYVAVLLCGGVALYIRPEIPDLPAWVQAVGSVVAILAAVWIAQWQARRERRDRMEARREFRKAVAVLATRLSDLVATHAQSLIENPSWHMHEGSSFQDFKILDSALDRFAPSELVSADGVLALEELRSEARAAGDWEKVAAQEYAGVAYFDFDVNEAIRRWSERAKAHAMVLEGLSRQSE